MLVVRLVGKSMQTVLVIKLVFKYRRGDFTVSYAVVSRLVFYVASGLSDLRWYLRCV